MIPKIVHLCWFSNDPYPAEIKMCLDTWHRIIPDYKIKVWNYEKAKAIGIPFIDEALEEHRWAFAADVVRFYAVWKDGGVYMDSDIKLFKRFDDLLPEEGFMTFCEKIYPEQKRFGLQAAFFAGSAGNNYCERVLEYYKSRHYRHSDGSVDNTISPYVMTSVAESLGYEITDTTQDWGDLKIYPTHYLAPRKRYKIDDNTIGQHQVYGSWRKRKFGRKVDIKLHHLWYLFQYYVLRYF